jgi:hypothetical protein
MIEKMIIQDSSEVHSVWIPDRRSLASFAIWKAFGLGHNAHWRDGQIVLGIGSDDVADSAEFASFPGEFDRGWIPGWVDDVIDEIDASLPEAASIIAALEDDSTTLTLDPPAYRIPSTPTDNDVATCIIAARLLLAVPQRLVPPILQSMEEVIAEIDFASRIAVLLGGADGRRTALSAAADPGLCAIIPDPGINDDLIHLEQADD